MELWGRTPYRPNFRCPPHTVRLPKGVTMDEAADRLLSPDGAERIVLLSPIARDEYLLGRKIDKHVGLDGALHRRLRRPRRPR